MTDAWFDEAMRNVRDALQLAWLRREQWQRHGETFRATSAIANLESAADMLSMLALEMKADLESHGKAA